MYDWKGNSTLLLYVAGIHGQIEKLSAPKRLYGRAWLQGNIIIIIIIIIIFIIIMLFKN